MVTAFYMKVHLLVTDGRNCYAGTLDGMCLFLRPLHSVPQGSSIAGPSALTAVCSQPLLCHLTLSPS